MSSTQHPFDTAIALQAVDAGQYKARLTPEYGNMVGPFGGAISAVLLNAVESHGDCEGRPLSVTVNFCGPIADDGFNVQASLMRANRTNQHWLVQASQEGQVVATASVVMAQRRQAWSEQELVMPRANAAEELPPFNLAFGPKWISQYDMRFAKGEMTMKGQELSDSETLVWIADKTPRILDYRSILSMSDAFFPRLFVKKQAMMPAGTITLTTHFHADDDMLSRHGQAHLLGRAIGQRFHMGYFDQIAELWSPTEGLMATGTQVVYYKT